MKSRTTRLRLRIAILLGVLLLLAGAAAVSAASVTLPGAGGAGHTGGSGSLEVGARQTLGIPIGGLTPGQAERDRQVVVNGESQALRYSVSSVSADDDHLGVRDILRVTIRTADLGSGAAGTCERFDGPALYDGPLGTDAAGFGDARMGAQSGDRVLAPGATETLCFEIKMPIETGNEYQGATTATTWTVVAEQEAGNP
jgi:hypothetical protein